MKILMLSRDPTLLSKKSEGNIHRRFEEYSKYMEIYNINIGNRNMEKKNLNIYGASQFPILYFLQSLFLGFRIIKERKIEIINPQDPLLCGIVGYLLHLLSPETKFVVDVHSGFFQEYWKKKLGIFHSIGIYILKKADAIRTVSKQMKKELKEKGFEKVFVCPVGIDINPFLKIGKKKQDSKIIFVGRVVEEKNLELLINAMNKLKNKSLTVVGEGKLLEKIKRDAPKNVNFLGGVPQKKLPSLYANADILILPSKSESWGMVIVEAFASGIPAIVSSNVKSVGELVVNGKTGFVFESGNEADLVKKIKMFFSTPKKERKRMGKKSRIKSMEYSLEKMAGKRYKIFKEVLVQ
ncbi:glycosyltransferase family 4 protein [Candidatus Micrarchaeota archaeon]|nr:glycosyltransferase family 4 protein [Candidatus Micrarchaeota archaeon]